MYRIINLNNKNCIMDGKNALSKTVETPYFGFYFKGKDTLSITNKKSVNTYIFVKEK